MNSKINYKYIINLITNLHGFIDDSENKIKKVYSDYYNSQNSIKANHAQSVAELSKKYNSQNNELKAQAQKMISDAKGIYNEILKIEDTLALNDKYYVKTRAKCEQELIDHYSDSYNLSNDYFKILNDIKSDYQVLALKYSNRKHKGIIDGLDYAFSSQRKNDYEQIIILKNTIKKVIDEINETIPELTGDSLNEVDQVFLVNRDKIEQIFTSQKNQVDLSFSANIENLSDQICNRLDQILPDEFIDEIKSINEEYTHRLGKVDTTIVQLPNLIMLGFIKYPYKMFIESNVISQLIQSKCEKLIDGDEIKFPLMFSIANDGFNWMIQNDEITSSNIEKFTHSLLFSFLSFTPISKVKFSILDIENRGNSVLPFLELKKKHPEIFYDKILTSQEEVRERLYVLNNYIDDFIQNKLGNKYQNIFEYNMANAGEIAPITLMVLYDFPKGFDEVNIAELKNVLKNGNKCGVFTLILHSCKTNTSGFYNIDDAIKTIIEQCSIIKYEQGAFIINALEIEPLKIPTTQEINQFTDKYVLIMEGKNNESIVFPSVVKNLLKLQDEVAINKYVENLYKLQQNYISLYGRIQEGQIPSSDSIFVGTIQYPMEIFSSKVNSAFMKYGFVDKTNNKMVQLPFTCDFDEKFNIMVNSNEENQKKCLEFSHICMMNFISSIPYGNLVLSVFDPEKRGNSIIPFLDFRKKVPELFGSQIYTSQEAIYQQLTYFNNYIDEFIQEKLGNKFLNIMEYNMAASSKQEPIHLLVFYDFPKEFENRSYDLLVNLLKNGSKCGVFVYIDYNSEINLSKYDNHEEFFEQIKKNCSIIDYLDGSYYLNPYNLKFSINNMISQNDMQDFVEKYTCQIDNKKKKGLSFDDIISSDLFSMDSAKSLSIPMGVGDGNSIVNLIMGEGSSHHGLIAGATGSGKSTLLHTIIMSAMLNYSPDKLNLYLMDFKSGTEFKIYDSVKLPHIKLLALDAMQEFGESILENLVSEMEHRGELFKSVGETSLKGYSASTGKSLPRILVIMDEFQILFNDASNRKIALNCAELTKRIVTEGRAFGIHLLMATQSTKVIRDLTLQQGTIEQMRIRIGLKCGEDDARYLFSDKNDTKALELMKGPIGTAVLNREYIEDSDIGFRTAYCDPQTQQKYLNLIAEKYSDDKSKPQIFEGNRVTNMVEYLNQNNIEPYESTITNIYFGDKIKVAPPFILDVDRRRKHNLLICGSNERMSENINNLYMLSVSLNRKAKIYCFDGDMIVGDRSSEQVYNAINNCANNMVIAESRGDIITHINEIYADFLEKRKNNSDNSIFVFIKNLQWLDIIQKMLKDENIDENEYIEKIEKEKESSNPFDWGVDEPVSNESISYKLRRLIDEGSACGIYFIISSTEYVAVKESMYYSDNVLSKFPERIIFSLSDNDADSLIDGVSVSQMKDNTVYYTDGIKNTFQFKPYIINEYEDILRCYKK